MINSNNRTPVAAGRFYPANKEKLIQELALYFESTSIKKHNELRAIISPHAGYIFSGETAAHAYSQIPKNAKYNTIFILASSHHAHFNGASIYAIGDYITPLGKVSVDKELAGQLIKDNAMFSYFEEAHTKEHSLEVQLPFLQQHLKEPFKIIPIVIGTNNNKHCKEIAEALKPYFTPENLFIISTDFSHYPEYNDALNNDKRTADAICSNDSSKFLDTLEKNRQANISQLQTSICGWTSILTLLYLTESNLNIEYNKLHYSNSGDNNLYGDKSAVVGYTAISATEKPNSDFNLSDEEKTSLLKLARTTLVNHFYNTQETIKIPESMANIKVGAFVTLHIKDKLKGCIGQMQSNTPLKNLIPSLTLSSALNDHRYTPVTADELNDISIEISILSPLEKVNSLDDIKLGKHGIFIKKGILNGTFLPQVATETGWSKEEFLGHCSKQKVGISWDGWKNAELYRYEAFIFSEK